MGKVKVISDFLPSPEELALKDETVKVTISLSKASVDFFKNEAKKHNTQYQKMIRRLLDEYTAQHPYRDRKEPHSSSLPHHAAYGSVLRDSADQASSAPGERKPE